MDRRHFLLACLAAPFACSTRALAEGSIYIGDMHFHLFFVGPRPAKTQPLGASMAAGNATLVGWSLVGDQPWLVPGGGGFKQKGAPKDDEARTWLRDELKRVTAHIAEQNLRIVKTTSEIDRALGGDPHVVLSVEGATFADNDLASLQEAYDLGVRQVQLVHYIRNPLGDFQTSAPDAQWPDRVRQEGPARMQPPRHSGRSRPLHRRCRHRGARHRQGAVDLVA